MRGKFITLEGIDGAGKSTHQSWLIDHLRARGRTVVATREPGGTPLGEKLRELLLHEPMHLETEALLMFAARREHLERLIRPTLERGDWVVSDRFTDATYAYQGGGRKLDMDKIALLERWVHPDLQPDLTLLFDVPPEVACRRLAGTGNAPDRFERETEDFFCRVRAVYLERAAGSGGRIRVIDARKSIAEIHKELEEIIASISK
ncbi:MAG: dTMP kinase [Pseudomonadota bacterium]|jgi:dTMP kinase